MVRVKSTIKLWNDDRAIITAYYNPAPGSALPGLPFAQLGLPQLPKPGGPEQFALLNSLIQHCNETHDCMSTPSGADQPAAKLPTRMIDVGSDCPETAPVRLVQMNTEGIVPAADRYIALSHRWGDLRREQRCCTYADNIVQRLAGIEFDTLPATFRDAVRVTHALAVRYLWIDSLCIIQDDEDDWDAESGRMEDVYSQAYCTIAASSATSSLVGFLGSRRPRDLVSLPMPGGEALHLGEIIDDFEKDVENSVLSSRGWVLQERALSRRIIYFTSTQVYWECGNGIICETLAQLRNSHSHFLGDSHFPLSGLKFYKDERILLVQHFYAAYSALAVSHATDRAQAVAGLKRRIARAFKSASAHGVLWTWPERTLIWRSAQPGGLTRIDYSRHNATPSPPSWSWQAYEGRIEFVQIPFGGAEWTGRVQGEHLVDGHLRVEASALCVEEPILMTRAVLDVEGAE